MDAGTATSAHTDIFDRIGDAFGNVLRAHTTNVVDGLTVATPFGATRALFDPEGTKASVARVRTEAEVATSILNPGYGIAKWLGTDSGKHAVQEGADAAVKASTDYVKSPFSGIGLFLHAKSYAQSHPDQVARAAKTGFDVATITNPGIAWARGVAAAFGH